MQGKNDYLRKNVRVLNIYAYRAYRAYRAASTVIKPAVFSEAMGERSPPDLPRQTLPSGLRRGFSPPPAPGLRAGTGTSSTSGGAAL